MGTKSEVRLYLTNFDNPTSYLWVCIVLVSIFLASPASASPPGAVYQTVGDVEGELADGPLVNVGDVNDDGFMDFAVRGNPVPDGQGEVRLYFGGALLDSVPNLTIPSPMADPSDGFSVHYFGNSISGGGDLNGDGIDDLVIGTDNLLTTGFVFVYFGGTWPDVNPDVTLNGFFDDDRFGHSVAIVGDVNDDSIDDLAVGTYNFSTSSSAYVYFGGPGAFDPNHDLELHEVSGFGVFGSSVAPAGDFNGDNIDDFMVGAQFGGNDENGRVYVYLGGPAVDNLHDLSLADTSFDQYFGGGTSAGDFNGDGYDDIAVSESESGRVYLFNGKPVVSALKTGQYDKNLTSLYPGPTLTLDDTAATDLFAPEVSTGHHGNTAVTWVENTNGHFDVFVRFIDRNGIPIGQAQRANTFTSHHQSSPEVAMDKQGNTIVVWSSAIQDEGGSGIYGQKFDAFSNPVGGEIQINQPTAGGVGSPDIAMAPNGAFVVVWNNATVDGIYGMWFDRWGTPFGEFPVSSIGGGTKEYAQVEIWEDGSFLVTWMDRGESGTADDLVLAQKFDRDRNPSGNQIQVNLPGTNSHSDPHLFVNPDGSFGITWAEYQDIPSTGRIFIQLFDTSGQKIGPPLELHNQSCGLSGKYDLDSDDEGNFLLTWAEGCNGTYFHFHQLFSPAGEPQGGPVLTASFGYRPSVGVRPQGGYFVAWDNFGIFGKMHDSDCNTNGVADLDDIQNGTSQDLNANGVPDECEDDTFTEFAITNGSSGSKVRSIAGGFDVEGDGYDDLVIGFSSPLSSPSFHGDIHLFQGGEYFDQIPVTSIYGTQQNENLGGHLAPFGDLNGDGLPDLLVSSSDVPEGAIYGLSFNPFAPPLVTIASVDPITENVGPISINATYSHQGNPLPSTSLWRKMSGPGRVLFSDPDATNIEATFNIAGTYVLRLTVATEKGNGFDEVTIEIPPAVSTYGLTPPASPLEFLTKPRIDDAAVAADYYQAIDPLNEKDDFEKWKAANGFPDSVPTVSVAQGSDCCTGSAFFNAGDLGFGRRMIMSRSGSDYAYSVTNYATVEEAIGDVDAVATVSMEWSPGPAGGAPFTKFYIFQDLDGDGIQERVPSVDLDGNGPKSLPALCISCHGGQEQPSDYRANGITGAYFLPFDLEAFDFSTEPGVRREDQEEAFKEFNAGILNTNPSPAIQDLIQGWYGGPSLQLTYQDNRYVPQGWLCEPYGNDPLAEFYKGVIGPSCRVCHSSRTPGYDFMEASDFVALRSTIEYDVFSSGSMPHAKVTYENFWNSTLPHQPDLLKFALDNLPQNVDCVSSVENGSGTEIPAVSRITEVYPNPFNPRTTIRFDLHVPGSAKIRVFDLRGRLIATLDQEGLEAGRHELVWAGLNDSGARISSGSYIVQLEASGQVSTQRLTMLK